MYREPTRDEQIRARASESARLRWVSPNATLRAIKAAKSRMGYGFFGEKCAARWLRIGVSLRIHAAAPNTTSGKTPRRIAETGGIGAALCRKSVQRNLRFPNLEAAVSAWRPALSHPRGSRPGRSVVPGSTGA